jgi:hypothetical protein
MQAGECHVHSAVLKSAYLRPMKSRKVRKLILRPSIFPTQFPNAATHSLLNFVKLQQVQFRVILRKRILLIREVVNGLALMEEASDSVLQASAARFLIDGGQEDAASVLLSCELQTAESGDSWFDGDEQIWAMHVKLTGPRAAYDVLRQASHPVTEAIKDAIQAVLPSDRYVKHLTAHAQLVDIDPDWRTELLEIARGRGVHNQAVQNQAGFSWKNLRFRSKSEVRVAQALDNAGVLFLPNCLARMTAPEGRKNREADFLVCCDGRWGILEVDGEPFHPPSRTVQDHERDRLFRGHGIRVIEHFDSLECFEHPEKVVQTFLNLLRRT